MVVEMNIFLEWYRRDTAYFEIVKDTMNRETCFAKYDEELKDFKFVRGIKAHSVSWLRYYMDKFGFFRKPTNIYSSIAILKGMPNFTLNLSKRSDDMKEFRDNFKTYVTNYNMFLDLDPKPLPQYNEEVKRDALETFDLLNEFSVKFSTRMTGKGFHIFFHESEFDWLTPEEKPSAFSEFANRIKHVVGIKTCDAGLFSQSDACRRIYKTPFSLDVRSGNACLPLTKKELENFTIDSVKPENVSDAKIYKSGLLYQNMDKKSRLKDLFEELRI